MEYFNDLFDELTIDPTVDTLLDWETCSRCPLHKARSGSAIVGGGFKNNTPTKAISGRVLVIGQYPGKRDMEIGFPFTGPEGKRTVNYLCQSPTKTDGIPIEDMYFTNILGCWPGKTGLVNKAWAQDCLIRVRCLIYLMKPILSVTVGSMATRYMLGTNASIREMSRQVHYYDGIPLVVTQHPAILGRLSGDKRRLKDVKHSIDEDIRYIFQVYQDLKK